MGDKRLQELARAYARNEIPIEAYRAERAALLDALAPTAASRAKPGAQPESMPAWQRNSPQPPWLIWLPWGIAALALGSALFWILASS